MYTYNYIQCCIMLASSVTFNSVLFPMLALVASPLVLNGVLVKTFKHWYRYCVLMSLYSVHCIVYTLRYTVYSVHFIFFMYTIHYKDPISCWMAYWYCRWCSILNTIDSCYWCTLYSVLMCTVYTVHYTQCSVHMFEGVMYLKTDR